MNYRRGVPADAEDIAALIASFQPELTDDPSGAGAEHYLDSVTAEAERNYLLSDRYTYTLAIDEGRVVGFVALRDGSHVFHLFVSKTRHGCGLARRLWNLACTPQGSTSTPSMYTVNSSLNAVPVYKAFGFIPAAGVTHVHGISFLPMQFNSSTQ